MLSWITKIWNISWPPKYSPIGKQDSQNFFHNLTRKKSITYISINLYNLYPIFTHCKRTSYHSWILWWFFPSYHGILELLYFIYIDFLFFLSIFLNLIFLLFFLFFFDFLDNEEACDHGHMTLYHRPKT